MRQWRSISAAIAIGAAALGGGCASRGPDSALVHAAAVGEYGAARDRLVARGSLTTGRETTSNLLDRVRLLVVDLADGQAAAAEENANAVYEILRTQGINADRTVASVVLGDGVRYWKGEPFEQALAFTYVALQKAMIGDWGNARAAAEGSLFLLRDFGENASGRRLSQRELAERAASRGEQYLDSYRPRPSDFAPGYLLSAIASLALGDHDAANERFADAISVRPDLAPTVEALRSGRANTVLVADFGLAPTKIATGPQGAIAAYEVNTWSDRSPLGAWVGGGQPAWFPVAADINTMAADHSWRNLEDVRVAKAAIGQGLIVGGAVLAGASDNRDAQIAGLAMILAGIAASATAQADTRHNELLPQRIYFAAVEVASPDEPVRLSLRGRESAPIMLGGLAPPESAGLQVRYVRMNAPGAAPAWASSDRIYYRSDEYSGPVAPLPGARVALTDLPYILGGQDVSIPTHDALARYQDAGFLAGYTLGDLISLYREERITLSPQDQGGHAARHILEGGTSLVAPLGGTVGFARLFQVPRPMYRPRSESVRRAAREEWRRLESLGLISP